MNLNKILLIEDDNKKIDDIKDFIQSSFPNINIIVCESYQSGLKELLSQNYDLLLLDMSIPTWDKTPTDYGSTYQKFGGYKILKELKRKQKTIPTILITMFDDFGDSDNSISLEELDNLLKKEFEFFYNGAVYYNSQENRWIEELDAMIISI